MVNNSGSYSAGQGTPTGGQFRPGLALVNRGLHDGCPVLGRPSRRANVRRVAARSRRLEMMERLKTWVVGHLSSHGKQPTNRTTWAGYLPQRRWSDASSWPDGRLPRENVSSPSLQLLNAVGHRIIGTEENVVLPPTDNVLLDIVTPKLLGSQCIAAVADRNRLRSATDRDKALG